MRLYTIKQVSAKTKDKNASNNTTFNMRNSSKIY